MSSVASKKEDPMQIYKVQEMPCDRLTVIVKDGIIKGADDNAETYIELSLPTYPEPELKQETCKSKTPNPEWNESFKFHMCPKEKNTLDISLYIDDSHQEKSIPLNDLFLINIPAVEKTLIFENQTEIHLQLVMTHNVAPDLCFGMSLNKKEDEFLRKRKLKILDTMKTAFGEDGPNKVDEVPVIGVLGSGGGFRATIAFSGVLPALYENGLLDMTCYMAGLSGSAWFLSFLNSHLKWPVKDKQDFDALWKDLTDAMTMDKSSALLDDDWIDKTAQVLQKSKSCGQDTHFIDYFGYALGDILLKGGVDCGLSGLQYKVAEADVPLPLYSCINVKDGEDAKTWHEWVEFSPYEVGFPKYGVFMTPQQFGNHFFRGRCCTDYPERLLHYYMGIWGSAFNITIEELVEMPSIPDAIEEARAEYDRKSITEWLADMCCCCFKSSRTRNKIHPSDPITPINVKTNEATPPKTSINVKTNDVIPLKEVVLAQPEEVQQDNIPFWKKVFTLVKVTVAGVVNFITGDRVSPAVIKNFLSDLSFHKKKPIENNDNSKGELFKDIFEPQSPDEPILLADAGLAFNLPFPLLLRERRSVDIILSFDFSEMETDQPISFQELILAELWAKKHGIPFPAIDENIIKDKDPKECYIFEDKDNPECPVVIHFILANIAFRNEPGLSEKQNEFRNFELWDGDYDTLKFTYEEKEVDRLRSLMEYNTNQFSERVKEEIKKRVMMKRNPRVGPMTN